MKTVKFFLGAMALAVVSMVAAPAVNAQENKDAEGNTIRHPYLTNGLWDNWFVNVNPVGLNLFYDGGEWATGYAIDVNVGKWVTPSVGLRAGFSGITGMDAKYGYIHGEAMWNISNAIGGYKESRIWDFVPYAHAGLMIDKPIAGKELAAGAGLLNVIRLGERVDLTLDVRGTVYKRQGPAGFISTALGLSFNLGKTNFVRASNWHNPKDVAALDAAAASAAALTAANQALEADKAKLTVAGTAITIMIAVIGLFSAIGDLVAEDNGFDYSDFYYQDEVYAAEDLTINFDYSEKLDPSTMGENQDNIDWYAGVDEYAVDPLSSDIWDILYHFEIYDVDEFFGYATGQDDYYMESDDYDCAETMINWLMAPPFEEVAGQTNLYTGEVILSIADYIEYLEEFIYEHA